MSSILYAGKFWLSAFFLCVLVGLNSRVQAQDCYKPIAGPGVTVGALSGSGICVSQLCLGSSYGEMQRIIDNDLDSYASWGDIATLLNFQGVTVKSPTAFPAGHVAGFIFARAGLANIGLLNGVTVSTLLNGTVRETKDLSTLLSGNLAGSQQKSYATFITTQSFDEVRLNTGVLSASLLASFKVYSALAFPQDCSLENNQICDDVISGPGTDVTFSGTYTCVGCSLSDGGLNIIDANKTNYTNLIIPGSLLTTVSVGVLDRRSVYPGGNRAGFVIAPTDANTLLSLDVLNGITVQTYLFGQLQEGSVVSGSGSGLFSGGLLSGAGNTLKQKVGFVTTKPFNEVRIKFNQTASANLGSIRIYNAFEEPYSCGDCNVSLIQSNADLKYKGVVETGNISFLGGPWTGTYGVAVHSLSGTSNVVNADLNDFATYNSSPVSAVAGVRFTVKNSNGAKFPQGTFAGFNISKQANLIGADLLGAITIKAYDGNTLVDESSAGSLLGGSVLGGGTSKTMVGFYPDAPFNKIMIDINMGLLSGSLLGGDYYIYDAFVIEDDDKDGVPNCHDQCPTGNDNIDTNGDGIPDCAAPAFADLVTVKKLANSAQTSFVPGESVQYTITVTNNGPAAANAVHVVDNAPANTSISSWTASGTNATPPAANGTGNINQTIATMPNGSSVTYIVTLKTETTFSDPNLINIVGISSTTDDPDPTCPKCMTEGLPPAMNPDLTPNIILEGSSVSQSDNVNVIVRIENIGEMPTSGNIVFSIIKLDPAFSINFSKTMTAITINGTNYPVSNSSSALTMVEQANRYVFTINGSSVLQSLGRFDLGLVVNATGVVQSTANLSVTIQNGTGGGEKPFENNQRVVKLGVN